MKETKQQRTVESWDGKRVIFSRYTGSNRGTATNPAMYLFDSFASNKSRFSSNAAKSLTNRATFRGNSPVYVVSVPVEQLNLVFTPSVLLMRFTYHSIIFIPRSRSDSPSSVGSEQYIMRQARNTAARAWFGASTTVTLSGRSASHAETVEHPMNKSFTVGSSPGLHLRAEMRPSPKE